MRASQMRGRRAREADRYRNAWAPSPRSRSVSQMRGRRARETGGRIKPGAQAPGSNQKKGARARVAGGSAQTSHAVARFAGSTRIFCIANLGLAPQALLCRPLRGLGAHVFAMPMCFMGSAPTHFDADVLHGLGAHAFRCRCASWARRPRICGSVSQAINAQIQSGSVLPCGRASCD